MKTPEIVELAGTCAHVKRTWKHRKHVADLEPDSDLWAYLEVIQAAYGLTPEEALSALVSHRLDGMVKRAGVPPWMDAPGPTPIRLGIEHLKRSLQRAESVQDCQRAVAGFLLWSGLLSYSQRQSEADIPRARLTMVPQPKPTAINGLTGREQQVLRGVAEGLTAKQIGAQLGISFRTVQTHRVKLERKLGVKGAVALARISRK